MDLISDFFQIRDPDYDFLFPLHDHVLFNEQAYTEPFKGE